jgi:Methyltransferase domain
VPTQPWNAVDDLVVAVGGRDEQVLRTIAEIGPAVVAELLAAEIQLRGQPWPDADDRVNLVMEHAGQAHRYVASVDNGRLLLEPGRAADVLAEVRHSLLDLTRLLYPHRAGYASTSRDVEVVTWPWTQHNGDLTPERLDEMVRLREADPEQLSVRAHQRFATLFKAVHAVIAACSSRITSLDELAALYGSDKWGGLHWYTPHYERHFGAMRYDPVRLLEIGIGGYKYDSLGGNSLYTWQRYFPRGLVYGLDVFAKPNVVGPRIRTIQGDQSDAGYLRELGSQLGPFDIVIDDGSHVNEHVRTSFEALFPYVRPGGYYVIEDLHTSYWPDFGGELPPGSARTTVGLLKDLLDRLQLSEYAENENGASRPTHPSDVSVYHNLAFLRKGINHERGVPAWIKQRAGRMVNPAADARGRN